MQPTEKPARPLFSSGPCAKRPGWSLEALRDAPTGRSHRAPVARRKLEEVIERSRALLGIPDGWRLGIVPGSDTGAFEMALWSMLGARDVDVLAWESFGAAWKSDVTGQLGLPARVLEAPYGELPDLGKVDFSHDVVFTWNGTTSGVRVPDAAWIPDHRSGLTFCDATSAVFAMEMPFGKLDVVTWSWQKALGGEGGHGMLCLSPRAVERLESYSPPWPLPKLFRLTKGGKLLEDLYSGATINTPSMLCVEDALDSLGWAGQIGGLPELVRRSEANLELLAAWVEGTEWIDFLARAPETRSSTSICLRLTDPAFCALDPAEQRKHVKERVARLEAESVAFDIESYRDAPPGLRVWGGATVERDDLAALVPWLDWAFS